MKRDRCAPPSIAEERRRRDGDDKRDACHRTTRFLNADDDMTLFPEFRWSVPQKRSPVCRTQGGACAPHPSQSQTALIGTLLPEASRTRVGDLAGEEEA